MKKTTTICKIRNYIKKVTEHKRVVFKYNYNDICRCMMRNSVKDNHFLGMFGEWDNTPRHKDYGTIVTEFSLDKFREMCKVILKKAVDEGSDYIIFDAWNEWGEGAFLEPCNVYGYSKLKILKECLDELKEYKKD